MNKAVFKRKTSVRIIGGEWRGRLLPVLEKEGLRPTKDIVRETVFNWLQHRLKGKNCLDCFAGTGALGFEAASRGAKKVILVEQDREVARHLSVVAEQFEVKERIDILEKSVLDYLQCGECFDVIFLDPPFQQTLWQDCINVIVQKRVLRDAGVIYIESSKQQGLPDLPVDLHYIKQKRSGQVMYALAEWVN